MLQKLFVPCASGAALILVAAPVLIAWAPFESSMGLVSKIFYFHTPCAMLMLVAAFVCGIASAVFLATRRPAADHVALAAAELAVVFGLIALVTGPLWARKSWGVWWQWEPRLTSTLVMWMVFIAYSLLRRFGGPGSDRLGAGLALFGMANVPFIYWSVDFWRTMHPKTTVVPKLPADMGLPFWWCLTGFLLLFVALLAARSRLEAQRAALEEVYLALDEEPVR
jgi:heme exporter protein C